MGLNGETVLGSNRKRTEEINDRLGLPSGVREMGYERMI